VTVHAYNPSTPEARARGPQVRGQPGLQSKTLSQKQRRRKKKNPPNLNLLKTFSIIIYITKETEGFTSKKPNHSILFLKCQWHPGKES
jgi:hypothetical protein